MCAEIQVGKNYVVIVKMLHLFELVVVEFTVCHLVFSYFI